MKKKIILLACASITLSGCANNLLANRISSESYPDNKKEDSYSRVFAWDSKYSAGAGNSKGMCVQGALTADAGSIGASVKALKNDSDLSADAALEAAETVTALNMTNAQTAFANIAYFYACQIALNSISAEPGHGRLSDTNIVKLFESVSETIPDISNDNASIASAESRQLEAFKTWLQKNGIPVPEDLEKQIDASEQTDSD
ncbi:hypothetical protein AAG596_02670 [Citromicrobium bathyomarinum]|uniref:hypothetical protein n=1 Tax=Citromicrobium TaxID=72173 RepID=UPI0011128D7B|nr:hypothetical protein [Citromicrobium sp. JLT1363]